MINSKYAPTAAQQYSSKDLNANFKGNLFSAALGTVTNNDMLISDDHLIDGATLVCINAALGDKITMQVIDKDNVIGLGANTVLGQYVTDWYVNPNESKQLDFQSMYPAKIYGGLYLRIIYTSVGAAAVDVIINYRLHKVLW